MQKDHKYQQNDMATLFSQYLHRMVLKSCMSFNIRALLQSNNFVFKNNVSNCGEIAEMV